MRVAIVGAVVLLALALTGPTQGQGKKKPPALAYDARVVKLETKGGVPTAIYYKTSEEDQKKIGVGSADIPITAATKFVFVGPDGDKNFTNKTVLADSEAKKYLQRDQQVRLQLTAIEAEIVRFGPNLKPQPPKRVR